MHDMKRSELELKDIAVPSMGVESYPHGLKLHLEDDELKKLGITDAPKVGEKVNFSAKAEVVRVEMDHGKGDEKKFSVCLQITDMALEAKEKGVVDAMYGA